MYASRTAISGASGSVTATNTRSLELGERQLGVLPSFYSGAYNMGSSWFKWQAPRSGIVVFKATTDESYIEARVYRDASSSLAALQFLAVSPGSSDGAAVTAVVSGAWYAVQVLSDNRDVVGSLSWNMPSTSGRSIAVRVRMQVRV
jgi:hypothetical protein